MMATPAHPFHVERMQCAQKKQTMLFAGPNLALSESPSTNARSPPNVEQNLDRSFLTVLVIRYDCSQPNLEHIDSWATALETEDDLENMKLQEATMGEPSSNSETHSDLQEIHQCWPLMAVAPGYLGCVLEAVEDGMWAMRWQKHQRYPFETCK